MWKLYKANTTQKKNKKNISTPCFKERPPIKNAKSVMRIRESNSKIENDKLMLPFFIPQKLIRKGSDKLYRVKENSPLSTTFALTNLIKPSDALANHKRDDCTSNNTSIEILKTTTPINYKQSDTTMTDTNAVVKEAVAGKKFNFCKTKTPQNEAIVDEMNAIQSNIDANTKKCDSFIQAKQEIINRPVNPFDEIDNGAQNAKNHQIQEDVVKHIVANTNNEVH